jgi:signal transduction histidine kinase
MSHELKTPLSKLEAGTLELSEDEVDLIAALEDCMRHVEVQARKAKILLSISFGDEALQVRADGRRFRQIVLNLLSNAVKFTPKGGQVCLPTFRRGGDLVITIADTGIGIAADEIPRAMASFGQVESKIARNYEGTGLGLPLAKHLIELHGGTLALESEVNVGTLVTITFPDQRIVALSKRVAFASP